MKTIEKVRRGKTEELIAESAHLIRILDAVALEPQRRENQTHPKNLNWFNGLLHIVNYTLLILLGSVLGVLLMVLLGGIQ